VIGQNETCRSVGQFPGDSARIGIIQLGQFEGAQGVARGEVDQSGEERKEAVDPIEDLVGPNSARCVESLRTNCSRTELVLYMKSTNSSYRMFSECRTECAAVAVLLIGIMNRSELVAAVQAGTVRPSSSKSGSGDSPVERTQRIRVILPV